MYVIRRITNMESKKTTAYPQQELSRIYRKTKCDVFQNEMRQTRREEAIKNAQNQSRKSNY